MENKKIARTGAKKTIKELLAAEPRVHIYLPAAKYGSVWEGSIGGYPIILGTDQDIMVPESVAALIRNNDDLRKKTQKEFEKYTRGGGVKLREFEE